jgi:hypothetical protein
MGLDRCRASSAGRRSEADGFNTMLKASTRPLDTGELFHADELIGQ